MSSQLQLNDKDSVLYKEFYGMNVDQMPVLIADNRVPLSVNGLMNRRLEVVKSDNTELAVTWLNNYFDTGDAIVYHPDGRIKVVNDAQALREITPESNRVNGALVLTDEAYNSLDGAEFTRNDLKKHVGRSLRKGEVLDNPLWHALSREDKALLTEYAGMIFSKAKTQHGYDENMGLYLANAQEAPTMRLWSVSRLYYRGDADGDVSLDGYSGRLVGVAPEAQSVVAKKLEGKLEPIVEVRT